MTGGGVQMEQLPGVIACQTDDVIRHNWHGMLYVILHCDFMLIINLC